MFNDIDRELLKLIKPRAMNWNRIQENIELGTSTKPERNKFGKRNKSRLITPNDNKTLVFVPAHKMPKKISRPKHRTRTILADVLHKTKHY